jgi:NAD(P)-dependent dehydrogenase (short-subunit alcohol dehydrogenase family)
MEKRIVLVTGASHGLGQAVGVALAAAGCHLLMNGGAYT